MPVPRSPHGFRGGGRRLRAASVKVAKTATFFGPPPPLLVHKSDLPNYPVRRMFVGISARSGGRVMELFTAEFGCDVRPVRLDWLWPGYVPRGKLALLEGDP